MGTFLKSNIIFSAFFPKNVNSELFVINLLKTKTYSNLPKIIVLRLLKLAGNKTEGLKLKQRSVVRFFCG